MRRLIVLLILALVVPAAEAAARQRLHAFTAAIDGLAGEFRQSVYGPQDEVIEESGGAVSLKAPRQFRWEYRAPYPSLIVADGDHVWIYEPDMQQVTVRRQGLEEQDSPLAVLLDPDELDRQFRVEEAGVSDGLEWLALTPRKPDEAPFARARLGFDAGGLARMELVDALGQRTVMTFSGWRRNPRFPADAFVFTPPEGVDVVGEVGLSAEVIPLAE
ncbi:outer membrane lipoprotein chaperone LolA [Arenimonas fontis]|uniref:Outer-membrane lipoprotein carrier protein n=1 Tax=Arenimonas fontis TaxID=2608255 RepID=A0A5B2ZEL7_9GAMM|nr:outer membrane lipoprotein chaperone LolA [Arenimonas fontis]KAA2286023.1 outer membrane lipoprotein chaperone LolA [Arenimonas fontis]